MCVSDQANKVAKYLSIILNESKFDKNWHHEPLLLNLLSLDMFKINTQIS